MTWTLKSSHIAWVRTIILNFVKHILIIASFYSDVPFPEEQTIGLDSFIFNSCGTNVGQYGPFKEECISYYESLCMYHFFFVIIIFIQYYHNNIDNIIYIHDNIIFKASITPKWTCSTITSMNEENPIDNETYLGKIIASYISTKCNLLKFGNCDTWIFLLWFIIDIEHIYFLLVRK